MSFGIITNIDTVSHIWGGVTIDSNISYTCTTQSEALLFAKDSTFITDLSLGKATVSNGSIITNISDSIEYLLGKSVIVTSQPPINTFTAKTIVVNGVTKKLFKRMHGIQANVVIGNNTILYSIPYPWVKMCGVDLIGGELLDTASMSVLDTVTGTYSTIPNYQLNQLGFTVNVAKDFYSVKSTYDTDLYQGIQLKFVYNSISNKTIGINIDMNELKD